jgi:hypothetical protein
MAITRTVRNLEVHTDTDTQAVTRLDIGCRCVFEPDPDNPGIAAPERSEHFRWEYADLTDDEQAAVATMLNAMTARMDADHPINSGS